jgi:hypothetical protein
VTSSRTTRYARGEVRTGDWNYACRVLWNFMEQIASRECLGPMDFFNNVA